MYLGSGVVQHLLPGWVHGVPVCQEALFCHIHHLSGSSVHGHSPLIPQSCLLSLLLGLGEQTTAAKKHSNKLQKFTATIKRVRSLKATSRVDLILSVAGFHPEPLSKLLISLVLENIFKVSKCTKMYKIYI